MKNQRLIFYALLGFAIVLVAGWLYVTIALPYIRASHEPHSAMQRTMLLNYTGRLNNQDGPSELRIYKITKLSSSASDAEDVRTNKIELKTEKASINFTWATQGEFGGSDPRIVDLDRDGTKEILLYEGGQDARVVFYHDGRLQFRSGMDEISSIGYGVGPFEEGGKELFIRGVLFTAPSAADSIPVPRIMQWSMNSGFRDVTREHAAYYKNKLLPDLQTKMEAEADPGRRKLYKDALKNLQREIND